MDFIKDLIPLGQLTGAGAVLIVAWLVITRKLVWHTDLEKAEQAADKILGKAERERDEWKNISLSLLGVTEKLTVQAEVTNEVMSRIPTPRTGE